MILFNSLPKGSSPLVRGAQKGTSMAVTQFRIIPARAGSTNVLCMPEQIL